MKHKTRGFTGQKAVERSPHSEKVGVEKHVNLFPLPKPESNFLIHKQKKNANKDYDIIFTFYQMELKLFSPEIS